MDNSCGQPQGLKEMDRRQHFDCWSPHITINKVLLTEILLETPFDSSEYFGARKSELLWTVTEKQAFALYIGYIFFLFSSEPSRLDNVYWGKKWIDDIIKGRTQWSYILFIKYILNSSADSTYLLQLAEKLSWGCYSAKYIHRLYFCCNFEHVIRKTAFSAFPLVI